MGFNPYPCYRSVWAKCARRYLTIEYLNPTRAKTRSCQTQSFDEVNQNENQTCYSYQYRSKSLLRPRRDQRSHEHEQRRSRTAHPFSQRTTSRKRSPYHTRATGHETLRNTKHISKMHSKDHARRLAERKQRFADHGPRVSGCRRPSLLTDRR